MRILADVNIAPRTVTHLRDLGHDVERVGDTLVPSTSDEEIVLAALKDDRIVLTQDLDLSTIVALSGRQAPSIVTLRLSSARIESVNARLEEVLPAIEESLATGALVTIEDRRIRSRSLPLGTE